MPSTSTRSRRTSSTGTAVSGSPRARWERLRHDGISTSLGIAAVFFLATAGVLMLRQGVMPYRQGQYIPHDITARVSFSYSDKEQLERRQHEASDRAPRVYNAVPDLDVWGDLERALLEIPDRLPASASEKLPADLRDIFDSGALTAMRRYVIPEHRADFIKRVASYVGALRNYQVAASPDKLPIIILDPAQRYEDVRAHRSIRIGGDGPVVDPMRTYFPAGDDLRNLLTDVAQKHFVLALYPSIADFSLARLRQPTHQLDLPATTEAQNNAIHSVLETAGDSYYPRNCPLVRKTAERPTITQQDWLLLHAENDAYVRNLKDYKWKGKVGIVGIAFIMTVVLAGYIARYQKRVLKNHARAIAIAALLISMLLLNQLAALSNGPLYLFGIAPTILVAMILTIAYDQRTAIGISCMHAILATVAMDQGISFFIVIWVGVLITCFLLDEIRTRSKLIEVGGAAALGMVVASAAAGLLTFDPWPFVFQNCLYAGAAGLGVGFVVLGILPFVEKSFRITTSMTLLELADASQPLLRRLAVDAPGTYNHSLQVATIAEGAAEAIHADSLLCRVASYYHDVGKINKADYFVENQSGRESRHLNLTPSVSLLIIIGHVKDGVELAREYNLPTSVISFIQQHHGTTLVEYFYHQARTQQEQRQTDQPAISETQYRYPGPKPKSREIAIVMLADAVESASRALPEATASRVEALVHELAMKRLLDGQFDECDLTMRQLELIERSMVKTILGIYHGRIAYPKPSRAAPLPGSAPAAARSA